MFKLIIYVTGRPILNGYKQREFQWDKAHGCYIYEGKEFSPSEFNEKYEKAMKTNSDLRPRVRVLGAAEETDPEVIADNAEKTLEQLRPHRLKKKTGPKPEVVEVG